jgi:hypothetical protein
MNENNFTFKNNILMNKNNYNFYMNKNRSRNFITEENTNDNNENNTNNLLLNNLSLKTPKIEEKSFIDKMIEEDNIKYLKYSNKNNSGQNLFNFGRKKIDFNKIIKENIFKEEKPTFSDENDRNIDYLNDFMKKKNKLIEYNNQNYVNYMKKIKNLPKINELKERNKKRIIDNKGKLNFFFKDNEEYPNNNNNYKKINNNSIKFDSNIYNNDYYREYRRYKQEQKKYLDYNQNIMINNYNKHLKSRNEINVNPYNDYYKNNIVLGKSVLKHNPILNPQPYTGYQNYFSNDNVNNYSFSHKSINYDEILKNISNNMEKKKEDIINNNKYEEKSEKIYNRYKNIF